MDWALIPERSCGAKQICGCLWFYLVLQFIGNFCNSKIFKSHNSGKILLFCLVGWWIYLFIIFLMVWWNFYMIGVWYCSYVLSISNIRPSHNRSCWFNGGIRNSFSHSVCGIGDFLFGLCLLSMMGNGSNQKSEPFYYSSYPWLKHTDRVRFNLFHDIWLGFMFLQ